MRRPADLTEKQRKAWHETPFVHVYAQYDWHDGAGLVCNAAGLAVLKTLVETEAMSVAVFVNDGEGYDLHLHVVSDEVMDRMAVPYTDERIAGEKEGSEAIWPRELDGIVTAEEAEAEETPQS